MKFITTAQFEKQLDKLPKKNAENIYRKLADINKETANLDVKKLKGRNEYRIRVGDYRIFFEYRLIENDVCAVLKTVEHRKDAYKKR